MTWGLSLDFSGEALMRGARFTAPPIAGTLQQLRGSRGHVAQPVVAGPGRSSRGSRPLSVTSRRVSTDDEPVRH
jgi:hypothetical protein